MKSMKQRRNNCNKSATVFRAKISNSLQCVMDLALEKGDSSLLSEIPLEK